MTTRAIRSKTPLIFGWIVAAHQVGASGAAYLAGVLRTSEGNYNHAFMLSGGLCLLTAVLVLFIGRRPTAQLPSVAPPATS